MVRMSMNELTTYSWTFEEDVLHFANAGYAAIGVWRQKLSDFGEERGIELLRDHDLSVSNLMWAGGFTGIDGRRFRESVQDAIEAIHLAADLGSDSLIVYTGSRAGHTMNHSARICRNAIAELIPVAESCGVNLAIEPVLEAAGGDWSFLHNLDAALGFVDQFGSANVKLAIDSYHIGMDSICLKQLEEIAPKVAIVHLGDAKRRPRGEQNRCLLGAGVIPIADIVGALLDGGYKGYFDVELLGEDMEGLKYHDVLTQSRTALSQLIGV
ncbi:MAG: sugar phosphate isomerase/epimerase [Planctomycetales bacterium]|nr:sugar phosphate isomerase/epimerase [Planctomycetales bacterium]MCA9169026.1 sugar phosphate isomerase/epimerase [Planctomycetales bacterium]